MKLSLAFILIAVLLVGAELAPAQLKNDPNKLPMYFTKAIKTGAAYANSQIDTSGYQNLAGAQRVSLRTTVTDSVSYITKIDYRPSSSAAWSLAASDTIADATNAGSVREWVLRDNTTEKVSGVGGQWRIRQAFAASANGVTSPVYTQTICYTP